MSTKTEASQSLSRLKSETIRLGEFATMAVVLEYANLSAGESQIPLEVELICAELKVFQQVEAHGHVHYSEWNAVSLSHGRIQAESKPLRY